MSKNKYTWEDLQKETKMSAKDVKMILNKLRTEIRPKMPCVPGTVVYYVDYSKVQNTGAAELGVVDEISWSKNTEDEDVFTIFVTTECDMLEFTEDDIDNTLFFNEEEAMTIVKTLAYEEDYYG